MTVASEAVGQLMLRNLARMVRLLRAGILVILAGTSLGMADERQDLVERYRCEVAARMALIDHHFRLGLDSPFMVLSLDGQRYVQCLFLDDGLSLLCEASSGLLGPREGEDGHLALPASSISALAALGFETEDVEGNFQRLVDLSDEGDFDEVAVLLIGALHDGYGASARSQLRIDAPLAGDFDHAASCVPVG